MGLGSGFKWEGKVPAWFRLVWLTVTTGPYSTGGYVVLSAGSGPHYRGRDKGLGADLGSAEVGRSGPARRSKFQVCPGPGPGLTLGHDRAERASVDTARPAASRGAPRS
jgi:hypothetical protein